MSQIEMLRSTGSSDLIDKHIKASLKIIDMFKNCKCTCLFTVFENRLGRIKQYCSKLMEIKVHSKKTVDKKEFAPKGPPVKLERVMNNRELCVEYRYSERLPKSKVPYEGIVGSTKAGYIALNTDSKTDVYRIIRELSTNQIVSLEPVVNYDVQIKRFIVHEDRLICNDDVYDLQTSNYICSIAAGHIKGYISDCVIDKKRFVCGTSAFGGLKIFDWNGKSYDTTKLKYLRHRNENKYRNDSVEQLQRVAHGIYCVINDSLVKINDELEGEFFYSQYWVITNEIVF
jgi:hypothetical protein